MDSRITRMGQIDLIKLKSLREKVDWGVDKQRHEFLHQFYNVIRYWIGEIPCLGDIFRPEEIDWLLTECVKSDLYEPNTLVEFVIRTGYRDEPKVDRKALQSLRTTALHHAARSYFRSGVVRKLFKIYDRFDVNYIDDSSSGLTHFHVACMSYNCDDVVEKFLELGQDPNLIWPKTGESPLHLALNRGRTKVVESLLRHGADPMLVDVEGSTPLHVICNRDDNDDGLMKLFFKIVDDVRLKVQIDARDKLGRTPLQLAVANIKPSLLDVLLARGADLSEFVFPTENHFDESFKGFAWHSSIFKLSANILNIIESLEEKGYEFDSSDVKEIMKIFAKNRLFEKTRNFHEERLGSDEEFVNWTKNVMSSSCLSLYDLMRLRPVEAAKLFTSADHSRVTNSAEFWRSKVELRRECLAHLNEILLRGFCRRWALDSLWELIGYRLPILCCEKIIDMLMNEDLSRICLAVERVANEQRQNM